MPKPVTMWRNIAEYDAMEMKPRWCVFYSEPEINDYRPDASLAATISTQRYMGYRRITKFYELPNPQVEVREVRDAR
jgi:hypothetical protein